MLNTGLRYIRLLSSADTLPPENENSSADNLRVDYIEFVVGISSSHRSIYIRLQFSN